jgi:hypothetical protein
LLSPTSGAAPRSPAAFASQAFTSAAGSTTGTSDFEVSFGESHAASVRIEKATTETNLMSRMGNPATFKCEPKIRNNPPLLPTPSSGLPQAGVAGDDAAS